MSLWYKLIRVWGKKMQKSMREYNVYYEVCYCTSKSEGVI